MYCIYWSEIFLLSVPSPDHCLLVPFYVLDANALAGGERVQTNTTDALINFDDICNVGYTYDEAQYSILIKKGMILFNRQHISIFHATT